MLKYWNNEWWISLHMANGSLWFQVLLFGIAFLFAISLVLGYRTRLSMVVSWFLLISLHARNPLVLQGGDVVLRVVAFWMMFLPLNKRWSLDSLFNKTHPPIKKTYASVASIAYIVQICLLYVMTGFLKTGAAWHADGTATYYALSIDQLITPTGAWTLAHLGPILPYLTWFVLYVEMYGAILLFIPFYTPQFRILGLTLFAILQIGFNTNMRLGLFGLIAIGSTVGILPTYFWDMVNTFFDKKIRTHAKRGLSIYYDGDCTFCAKIVSIIKRFFLLHPGTHIAPGYTDENIKKEMDARTSWVIVDAQGNYTYGWSGLATILGYSPYLAWKQPLARLKPIAWLGEKVYGFVAAHRKTVCVPLIPEEKTFVKRLGAAMMQALLLVLLIYVILMNFDTLGRTQYINGQVQWIGSLTRLDQRFDMFAPTPLLEDGWYIFPGKLSDGTEIDVFRNGAPVSYAKPKWGAYEYKDQRWQKYMMNLWSSNLSQFREGYGKYLCREWNKTHSGDKQLIEYNMIFMVERTPAPGQPQSPVEPQTIWHHQCF
jgi:predicted DCC family thiol-disulfide oxidoreductase YuxK